ncbi:Gfo/Idh/MocA family oxidoreductase [uncultured Sunxiuqinia sp.]|uniref:Gfo/Idh/MocA family oxidoreductase n=1 Tax=uncultured Sunxiuqinia sp. TaxID=1573825 RepID=UPI002AA79E28|nr:Gfo/Idh/MocA family oxidoreductase [uncultured Sunxiuqinia sp.]
MSKVIQAALASFGMSGMVFHGPSLKVNPNFNLHSILERTKSLSEKDYPESTIIRSFEELISQDEVDLVIINTPDNLHYAMCKQALEAGKHVVVEKPFTQEVEQANELIQLAKDKNRILSVYQNRRWDNDFLTVKKILDERVIGRLAEFESHFDRYRNFIQEGTWKEEGDKRHGVLFNLGSHMIDQVVQLFGKPKSITAHLDTLRDGGQVKDYYDIRLQYNDFAAILKSSYLVREPGPRYSLYGTLGTFHKWGIDPQEEMLKNGHLPNEPNWGTDSEEDWGILNTEWNGLNYKGAIETVPGNYNAFYENIYDAIANGVELAVKPEESRDIIQLLDYCLQSDEEKRTIFL